jgi:hypothetical protein
MTEAWERDRVAIRRRSAEVLRHVAATEDAVAATFEELAASGRPEDRLRRMERAATARAGAKAARRAAGQIDQRAG